jgi:hypothetical protein
MTKAAAGASRHVVQDVGRALAGCTIWLLIVSALPRQTAGQEWFVALQGSSSSIRRDVCLREGMGDAGINPARQIG